MIVRGRFLLTAGTGSFPFRLLTLSERSESKGTILRLGDGFRLDGSLSSCSSREDAMKKIGAAILTAAACAAALVGMVLPETKVEVKGLHLCCGGCVSAATGAVSGAGGKDAKGD